MIFYGFSQKYIKTIRTEALIFIAENRKEFKDIDSVDFKLIDLRIMKYELENGKIDAISDATMSSTWITNAIRDRIDLIKQQTK